MIKIVAAGSGAWLLIGAVFLLPGMAPLASAGLEAPAGAAATNALAKADRLDLRSYGPHCSDRGWPYYEPNCIRNSNAADRAAKPVRIIATDRGPYGVDFAASR